jgi:site-specific DNA-methyltransferase (adenine-specific)/adenine-specific DNA-methyltransferase
VDEEKEGKKRVTAMHKLSEQEIERIVSLLKESKPLPEDYKAILFDTKKEYELIYADKEREEDILADTMAVPLQRVKIFRNGTNENGWTNMLIFGDNLQVLKTLFQMKQEGKLKNADGTPGVRLVYIDPPFGTGDQYDAKGAPAYSARAQGAKYVEFIRKRAILIRELMAEDSIIYVRIDYHFIHPIKLLLDEIFDPGHFINELIINRRKKSAQETLKYNVATDSILVYTKGEGVELKKPLRQRLCSFCNQPVNPSWHDMVSSEIRYPPERTFFVKKKLPPRNMHFTYTQDRIDNMIIENRVRIDDTRSYVDLEGNRERGMPQYLQSEETPVDSNWMDLRGYTSRWNYPTENSEELLERIVKSSSNPGDLVLDCFAGSGTTLAVAERLGRRWIGVDCGKLAIYTMQKRFLNIAESKDLENPKKKYGKQCKPFTLYNAGLYDYKAIKELPWEQYRDFALKLFQCRDEKHEISKIELDGYLGADSVMVFNYQKHPNAVLDRGFIDDLDKHLGAKIGRRFFIIAPAASVRFLEDYIEKGKTKYFVLRIPYSIIEEIHNRGFSKIKQPVSEMDVNDTVDAVGFDFIQVPTVECRYFLDKPKKADLFNQNTKECVIKIEKFESKVISRKPLELANLETLSMVMLDYDFDGEVFDLDEVFYAEDLKKNGYEVRFAEDKVRGQIMVIYIDIFGNEKREVKTPSDFNGKRKR